MDVSRAGAPQHQLDRWQRFAPCLGSNVVVIHDRYGCWTGSSGFREIETIQPMPGASRFYIFSITKPFAAARLLQVDLDLDRPISAFLRGVALPEGVTVRHLMNHTAGVPSCTDLPDYVSSAHASPGQP